MRLVNFMIKLLFLKHNLIQRNKKFNKLILLFYTLLYFVTYSPVCYLCAFFLVNFNTHQSFMSRIFSVAYLIALIPVKDLNTDKGVEILDVTLHVGLGTFRPVKVDDVLEHHMHRVLLYAFRFLSGILQQMGQNPYICNRKAHLTLLL